MKQRDIDKKFMLRCIELAEKSVDEEESPFGSVVTLNNKVLAESGNKTIKTRDITQHAEMRVILKAQKILSPSELTKCTLYTNCEPCPMCAFMIRELKFKRVVYAMVSPHMGGENKWNILKDKKLECFKPVFGKPPEVIGGFLKIIAKKTFDRAGWGPMFKK